jgi:hypothetical protein
MSREHRVWLIAAGQVVKVTSGTERVVHVAVSNAKGCRREYEEPVAEPVQDALPSLAPELAEVLR